jgi:PleD family two-component response regulator
LFGRGLALKRWYSAIFLADPHSRRGFGTVVASTKISQKWEPQPLFAGSRVMSEDQRLLVVDDEEAICEGCRRIFTRLGYEVEKTSDAQVGLHLAEKNEYAAILLDIKMPNMTGIEFLEQLRVKRPRVPVIS